MRYDTLQTPPYPPPIDPGYVGLLVQRCRDRDFPARAAERGLALDYRSVWAFVHAEKLTHKKS